MLTETGVFYKFILNVYSDDNNTEVLLGSASIDIYTKSGPIIFEDGFTIQPKCNHNFDYFIDSLFYGFDLYTSADGDYLPLLYTFNLQLFHTDMVYLHSYSQTVPKLSNVILPVSNFLLVTNVIDTQNAIATKSIACHVNVFYQYLRIHNSDNFMSESQINRYILQSAYNILHYLPNIINDKCKYNHFKEIIDVLSLYYNGLDTDVCSTSNNYLFTIQLAQSISGNKYANVLPEPVCDIPTKSRPDNAIGMTLTFLAKLKMTLSF